LFSLKIESFSLEKLCCILFKREISAVEDISISSTSSSIDSREFADFVIKSTNSFKITNGQKYIKVTNDGSVKAFIVKKDNGKFKTGDILKPAGWKAPAMNSARGNVLSGNYSIQWTGPLYLK